VFSTVKLAKFSALALVLLAWQLAALRGLPEYVLSPLQIGRYFVEALGSAELYENIGASLGRALPGFVLGSTAPAPRAGSTACSARRCSSPTRYRRS
jgi:ABC-type nitrate/sulfonate/bicarbonate transport system permease component